MCLWVRVVLKRGEFATVFFWWQHSVFKVNPTQKSFKLILKITRNYLIWAPNEPLINVLWSVLKHSLEKQIVLVKSFIQVIYFMFCMFSLSNRPVLKYLDLPFLQKKKHFKSPVCYYWHGHGPPTQVFYSYSLVLPD